MYRHKYPAPDGICTNFPDPCIFSSKTNRIDRIFYNDPNISETKCSVQFIQFEFILFQGKKEAVKILNWYQSYQEIGKNSLKHNWKALESP
ncbi:hypothetical protein AYI69_g11305 [Smittium culicis]|uniref:Uncharacterized protein n=1 Tax=Smittium culicis TaxID=133412 RepID=A0A1R1WZR8_9FUNG|nr:hypothetical protein AYI69_g11305 [Smittium culicis]